MHPLRLPLREAAASAETLTDATTTYEAPVPRAKLEMNGTDDFVSPFEEEYDVPAFIRRSRDSD